MPQTGARERELLRIGGLRTKLGNSKDTQIESKRKQRHSGVVRDRGQTTKSGRQHNEAEGSSMSKWQRGEAFSVAERVQTTQAEKDEPWWTHILPNLKRSMLILKKRKVKNI